jgi:hypothetical protein
MLVCIACAVMELYLPSMGDAALQNCTWETHVLQFETLLEDILLPELMLCSHAGKRSCQFLLLNMSH